MLQKKLSVVFLLLLSSFSYADEKGKTKISYSIGKKLIEPLLKGGIENTTNLRIENKNILLQSEAYLLLNPLLKENNPFDENQIFLEPRRKISKETKSLTTTIYGKKISFTSGSLKTNIKLRARIYYQKNSSKPYERIPVLKSQFFLELKLKNANSNEVNVSRKYRFLISDENLKKLYESDPKDPSFPKVLEELKINIQKANPDSSNEEIETFIAITKKSTSIDEEFIKPLFVIEYSRTGYKYLENYERKKELEYQITLDKEIKVFQISTRLFFEKPIDSYLKEDLENDLIYEYQNDLCFIEFKAPLFTKNSRYQKKSLPYKKFQEKFFLPLFKNSNPYGNYEKDKGKLATAIKNL